jgi:hypothetical protein
MTIDAASLQRHRAERFFQMAKEFLKLRDMGLPGFFSFQKQVFPKATLRVLMVNLTTEAYPPGTC